MAQDFTVAELLAWARTKPAGERYDYGDVNNCALCQFLRETGRESNPSVGGESYYLSGRRVTLPEDIGDAVLAAGDYDDFGNRWTFGRLVKRLEALCPATPVTPSDWSRLDAYLTDIELVRESVGQ